MYSKEYLEMQAKAVENGEKDFSEYETTELLTMLPLFGIYTQRAASEELLLRTDFSAAHLPEVKEKIRTSVWEEFLPHFLKTKLKPMNAGELLDLILGDNEKEVQITALGILGEQGSAEQLLDIAKQCHAIHLQNLAATLLIKHPKTTKQHLLSVLKKRGGLPFESQRLIVQEILKKKELSIEDLRTLFEKVDDEPTRQILLKETPDVLKQFSFRELVDLCTNTKNESLQVVLASILISKKTEPIGFFTTLLDSVESPRIKGILALAIINHRQCSQNVLRGILAEGEESFGEESSNIRKAANNKLRDILVGESMRQLFQILEEVKSSKNTSVSHVVEDIILERSSECNTQQLWFLFDTVRLEHRENICRLIINKEDCTVYMLGEIIKKVSESQEICLLAAKKVIKKLE